MSLKSAFRRFTTSIEEIDDRNLREFCRTQHGVTEIAALKPREEGTVVGEISSLRIVPKSDSSSWLEATINDGTGSIIALWTGRRQIAGVKPGARIILSGRTIEQRSGKLLLIYNPRYELL